MAIPAKKLFYKIGEVCQICNVEPHVLRYWETEFSLLSPTKNNFGQRIYRQKDLNLIEAIKQLLYEEGYTVAGANRKLLENGHKVSAEAPLFDKALPRMQKGVLEKIRGELEEILELLGPDRS